MEKKVTIYVDRLSPKRKESCFYYDCQIGIAEINGRIFSVESRGSLEVVLKGSKYKGEQVTKELISMGYGDKRFRRLYDDDSVIFGNWFALIEIDKEGDCISDDLNLMFDYDEVIDCLNNIEQYLEE